jgi:hypothetical protein
VAQEVRRVACRGRLMCTALARFVLLADEAKKLVERVLHR